MSDLRVFVVSDLYHSCKGNALVVDAAEAQSQLAALREELVAAKSIMAHDYDLLQQRLADAERRNAVYAELLNGWLAQFPKPGVTGGPITTLKGKTLAALNHKPEASSHD